MVERICISINNICNLKCRYCHFLEKNSVENTKKLGYKPMDIFKILDNVKQYVGHYKHIFKIGFIGNGEPLLNINDIKKYLLYIKDYENIRTYTITNGTIDLKDSDWAFLENHNMNVGFSLDGYKELHNLYRCGSFDRVMKNIQKYKNLTRRYPTLNATIGAESLENKEKIISFFAHFDTKITFSRMIGKYGISLEQYREFMEFAQKRLSVRNGGFDCTMYGGLCGVGVNNYFFSNGKVYLCGNCIDLPHIKNSDTGFFELEKIALKFNRSKCYKEILENQSICKNYQKVGIL
ncbi:radical SAM protein [Helicobacter sp. 16-1353]|uniref:radical SAM protein n=1 Tax=Helicobacter sp. 16-1353 TaxID=2004996 RepID=UPI000DCCD466|nr:radical SAM protein [Helicobacter sp. 16-1353]RAX55328.1 radical SAM protein [Helicobacter sp. 16-1353]